MSSSRSSRPQIAPLIRDVVDGSPGRTSVRDLVEAAWQIGLVYLRRKVRSARLDPSLFGLDLEDLALECIAPLFERDTEGRFPQLESYFAERVEDGVTESEAVSLLRRLVSSSIEQELFELHGASDPSLSRFIRSIKRAARQSRDHHLERRYGELWLRWGDSEEAVDDGPGSVITSELLEARLAPRLEEGMDGPDILEAAEIALSPGGDAARELPVTLLAWAVRSGLARMNAVTDPPELRPVPYPSKERLSQLIARSVETIREEKHPTYVESDKLPEETFREYMNAVERIVEGHYLKSGDEDTYFDVLSEIIPMSKDEYRSDHRSRLEYLVDLTREELTRLIRSEAESTSPSST